MEDSAFTVGAGPALGCGLGCRRGDLARGLLEDPLQLLQADLARLQGAAETRVGLHRCLDRLRFGFGLGHDIARRSGRAFRHGVELADELAVVAVGLAFGRFQGAQNVLDPVERGQDQGNPLGRDDECAVANLAEDILRGMRHRLEAGQAEETASALDRVHEAEDVVDQTRVVRVPFQIHDLDVEGRKRLVRLGQKLAEKLIHAGHLPFSGMGTPRRRTSSDREAGWPRTR